MKRITMAFWLGLALLGLTLAYHAGAEAAGLPRQLELEAGQGRLLHFKAPVDTVLVADPEIADLQVVSAGVIYVFGKRPGNTTLAAVNAAGDTLADIALAVSANATGVGQALRQAHPGSGVQVRGAGNRLAARGRTADVGEALELDALLDERDQAWKGSVNTARYAGSPQVNIRVRFAEVSRSELLRYGVSWNALFNNGTFSFGFLTGGALPAQAASGASNLISAGLASGNVNIDSLLEALQSKGVLDILAEPNITAVSGETASFLAGGEVPVPVPVNRDLVGIEYKSYGVSLLFKPTLLPDDRIALQVRPEVSDLLSETAVSVGGISVPSFRVRRADTRVEVGSGQTFAIAGLFQRNNTQDLEKVPGLGDLPVLGNLFRSKRFQRNETELVILITPYLVEPVRNPEQLRTPLDPPQRLSSGQAAGQPFGFYVR